MLALNRNCTYQEHKIKLTYESYTKGQMEFQASPSIKLKRAIRDSPMSPGGPQKRLRSSPSSSSLSSIVIMLVVIRHQNSVEHYATKARWTWPVFLERVTINFHSVHHSLSKETWPGIHFLTRFCVSGWDPVYGTNCRRAALIECCLGLDKLN